MLTPSAPVGVLLAILFILTGAPQAVAQQSVQPKAKKNIPVSSTGPTRVPLRDPQQGGVRRTAHQVAPPMAMHAEPEGPYRDYGPEVEAGLGGPPMSCDCEPGCGIEVGCGVEPGCGCEVPHCGCAGPCGMSMGAYAAGCDGGPVGCDSYGAAVHGCGWDPYCGPLLCLDWSRFDAFVGVQSFSGPRNFAGTGANLAARDGTGSFGFHEGFSHGRNLPWLFGGEISGQLGFRAVQSNFSGAEFTDATQSQLFLTVGLFRRVDYGFQGGVVYDYLHDDWYYQADLGQVRGELSYKTHHCTEFGYMFAAGVNDSNATAIINDHINAVTSVNFVAQTVDQNRIFYRHHFGPAASAEVFVGWTGESETLFGGQFEVPLSSHVGLATGFTWLSPDGPESLDQQQEAWNCFLSLVWRPVGNRNKFDYHLPLLPTADNGSMIVTTR